MNVTISLIRSGSTSSEEKGRFLGMRDEDISARGEELVRKKDSAAAYPPVNLVFSSALIRCRETARIIYPNIPAIIVKDLCAFDYGEFEGKLYSEILSDKRFQEWARLEMLTALPGGENPHSFAARCVGAFREIVREMESKQKTNAAIITHKSVIKTILQRFCIPRSIYRPWRVEWGDCYTMDFDTDTNVAIIRYAP